jgi:prevent-host-death family protein
MTEFRFLKTVPKARATRQLAEYVDEVKNEPLVVTQKGQPVAVLFHVADMDLEILSLSTDPDFLAMLERSRQRFKKEGGLSLDEVKKRFGIKTNNAKPKSRRQRAVKA